MLTVVSSNAVAAAGCTSYGTGTAAASLLKIQVGAAAGAAFTAIDAPAC